MKNAPCSTNSQQETIAAVATAPGRGGVGIIRISGPGCLAIALSVCQIKPKPRYAHYGDFVDEHDQVLDQGLSLYFPGPHSFTGEDVLELQAHGGPVILDLLLKRVCQLGARLARPGEFSERAYLNDKIDLAQAEAIADLIQASSEHAAKQALNSLKGVFSQKVTQLVESLIQLRIYVESAIDFPEEEIDFLGDGKILGDLETLVGQTQDVLEQAQQGAIVREGMKVAILGKPNAGKSSLLNALAAKEVAIVTDIAGTTRDVLREHIHLDGMPLHIIDTAGIRHSEDKVEQIGIERAWLAAEEADAIILLLDAQSADSPQNQWPQLFEQASLHKKLLVVVNKIDLLHKESDTPSKDAIAISVKTGSGLEQLKQALKQQIGYRSTTEGAFSARRRHVEALEQALSHLLQGKIQLQEFAAGELLAEELNIAQTHLSEITGDFSSDDLLGRIFSSFCIGK